MNELIKQPSYTVGKLLFTASPPPFCTIQFPVSKLARFRLTQKSQPLHLTRWKISFGFLDLIISKNNRRTDHSEDWWFFQTRTEHSLVKVPLLSTQETLRQCTCALLIAPSKSSSCLSLWLCLTCFEGPAAGPTRDQRTTQHKPMGRSPLN